MNKIAKQIAVVTVFSAGALFAKEGIITFDSSEILRNSKEGKGIVSQNEKDKEKVFKVEYEQQKKVNDFRAEVELEMKAGKLNEDDLQEKSMKMNRLQKLAKRAIDDVREEGEAASQGRVLKFRTKVHTAAAGFCKSKGFEIAFDAATPGMVYASAGINQTRELLKDLDAQFAKDKAKASLTKLKA